MSTPKPKIPTAMKAWQYTSTTKNGLENTMRLNSAAPVPTPTASQYLIKIVATALNPLDFKPAEIAVFNRLVIRKPATPGLDFAGYIVTAPSGPSGSKSHFTPGQFVFGVTGASLFAGGALAEYAIAKDPHIVAVPEHLDPIDAATIGVAGLTAYQTIVPHVKSGDRVFINGGSGGTGVFGIQIAKALGCHVTTTCSSRNVELCTSLGADEVIDYTKGNVVEGLIVSAKAQKPFTHVIDNIGRDPNLYWQCHKYTDPEAMYIFVGADLSPAGMVNQVKRKLWPSFLGGGKRKGMGFFAQTKKDDLEQIAAWMTEGKIRAVIDQKFAFEEAPRAIEKLKTGRARGKIVVEVSTAT
ncbi:hypothetical protein A1O1_07310 [Capronia coronata CBS 617.96]|uniref:Enoyl reductase (ER) domain-containing protein n=1 Tax=Capronia coronata CBS 617.96 TaxID=1182541 RepID=W9Y362_9EURO|nr:uncharacterized protein A1O1_07310 [Capronia coronata CBS 617.96]EXJ83686.1 hypothetical protein A1O1_07310 [Capronia coronata CBS 617.96]